MAAKEADEPAPPAAEPPLEPRFYPRVALRIPAEVVFDGAAVAAELRDVSEGGVGVVVPHPLPRGLTVTFRTQLPGAARPLSAPCQVTWSRKDAGGHLVGLEMLDLSADDEALIRAFVEDSDPLWWD